MSTVDYDNDYDAKLERQNIHPTARIKELEDVVRKLLILNKGCMPSDYPYTLINAEKVLDNNNNSGGEDD